MGVKELVGEFLQDRVVSVLMAVALMFATLFMVMPFILWKLDATWIGREYYWVIDLDGEGNPPAIFSALLWVTAAVTALRLAQRDTGKLRRLSNRTHWIALALFCLLLAYDEAIALHEDMGDRLSGRVPSLPVYSWTLYAGAVFLVACLFLFRFVLALPRTNATVIILGGAVFLLGAVGMETVGRYAIENGGRFPLGLNWRREQTIEEFCEMAGVILLIFALRRQATTLDGAGGK